MIEKILKKNPELQFYVDKKLSEGFSEKQLIKFLIEAKKNLLLEKATNDFEYFCNIVCKELFPTINIKEKWIKVLCKKLELLGPVPNKNFILNSCPRLGKTLFMSILYPCWLIGKNPKLKILILSASEQMRADTGAKIKVILNSDIYRKIFKDIEFISMGAEIKQTNKMGNITLLSSRTNLTGAGFNIIIGDDFFNPTELSTQHHITRQLFLENALGRKEHDPKTIYIILEQTLSTNDTTHILKEKWKKDEYIQLILPYQFNEQTIEIFENKFDDIEFELNEFISPRFNEERKDLIIRERGIETFLTQYQQIVTDNKNIIIKAECWSFYHESIESLDLKHISITTDLAFTKQKYSDYSVICAWGMHRNGKIYLLDGIRMRANYDEVKMIFIKFYEKWKIFKSMGKYDIFCNKFYIEDTTTSKPLISDLKTLISCIYPIARVNDKFSRLNAVIQEIKNGFILLPKNHCQDFVKELTEEARLFKANLSHKHDDIVDNFVDIITQELKGTTVNLNNYYAMLNQWGF